MRLKHAALVVPILAAFACAEPTDSSHVSFQKQHQGSGLELNSVTGLSLPLIGRLGDAVVLDQAVITNLRLVENAVGAIVGVEAEGVLQLTGGVLGTEVVTQDFVTNLSVTSSGPGQCGIVSLDLAPVDVNLLVAQVDVPAAAVDVRGSGAVGPLLCALGRFTNPVTRGVRGIVQALNRLI